MKRLFQATRRAPDEERCELCALPLPARHDHLYELRARAVRCACTGCALIVPTSERSPYRRIPVRRDAVALDLDAWLARLGSPVGIAAIVFHDDGRATVSYPGPAGLAEAELDPSVATALERAIRDASPAITPAIASSATPAIASSAETPIVTAAVTPVLASPAVSPAIASSADAIASPADLPAGTALCGEPSTSTEPSVLVREVEALVVANLPVMRGAWIVGIDVVFKMIAELRASWEGMTGGQRVGEAIARALEVAP